MSVWRPTTDMQWAIRIIVILLLGTVSADAAFCICSTYNVGPSGWHTLHIGGGGYLVNGGQSNDGLTTVARGDVYGGYLSYNGGQWVDVVNSSAMPSSIINASGFPQVNVGVGRGGPYEFVVDPGNNSDLAMIWMGYLLTSTNRGGSFGACSGWSQLSLSNNIDGNRGNSYRLIGKHIAIDPNDADVIYAGTPQNGMFLIANATLPASCTSTSISPGTIPTAGSASGSYPGYVVIFDTSGGTTGGKTNNIYIGPWGSKILYTTNAGSGWSTMSGGPTSTWDMAVCSNGALWVVSPPADYAGGNYNLWKYASGTWTQMTSSQMGALNSAAQDVSCDPNNASHIAIIDVDGNINWTSNGGTSWVGNYYGHQSQTATDVPWLGWLSNNGATNGGQLSPGALFFDNAVANKLWLTSGFGIWYAPNMSTVSPPPAGVERLRGNYFTAGTEVEDGLSVCAPPNGNNSVMLSAEQLLWYVSNTSTQSNPYPSNGTPSQAASSFGSTWSGLLPGWSCDDVGGSPNSLVEMANFGSNDLSGSTSNGGSTITAFSSETGATESVRSLLARQV